MAEYQILKPKHPLLKPYIEEYMYVTGEVHFNSKKIPPRPGASLLFDFKSPFYFDGNKFKTTLSGIQQESFNYRPGSKQTNHLVVRFQPYGLSRFTDQPIHEFTDQIVEPERVFGKEIDELYQKTHAVDRVNMRIKLVEQFLTDRLLPPSAEEKTIFEIAKKLRQNTKSVDFDVIRDQISLSTRQFERKFKSIVGINMQTYIRICRFDYAKSLILHNPTLSLTDISFDVGYYDQPHFAREVKRIAGVSPKELDVCVTN